ncbi:hypothetical protein LCGC14_2340310, partial [marine sediment metagenome]
MVDKVRIQDRITNAHLKGLLVKAGMSDEYVESYHDYAPRSRGKEYSPYAHFYRDRLSNQRIMVVSILPHITNAGFSIVPQFRQVGSKFISEENCFEAEIDNGTIKVTCVNDQPGGAKKFDQLTWHPQIYLNGVEQFSGAPLWLDTDPMNPGYHFNTVEWDYGFCKRRIRVIEGRIRERWVFVTNPLGEVRIKHNRTGTSMFKKSGKYWISNDEEMVPTAAFDRASYPFTVMASPETFFPDPHTETSSVDGQLSRENQTESWASIKGNAGNSQYDDIAELWVPQIRSAASASTWNRLARSVYLFDTTPLPNNAIQTIVVLSLYVTLKDDPLSISPTFNIYSSNPASNT